MRVVAANLQAKPKPGDDRNDVSRILAAEPQLVGHMEIGGMARALLLKGRYRVAGMTLWMSIPTPIVWPVTWELVAKGKVHLSGKVKNESSVGPRILRAKDAPWALLRDPATGSLHYVIVGHLAPVPDKNHVVWGRQIDALVAALSAVKAENPDVVRHLIADLNQNDRTKLTAFEALGMHLGRRTLDHGRHQLQYVVSDLDGDRSLIQHVRTDHKPVLADLEEAPVTRKPDYPKADADAQWFGGVFGGSTIDPNVVVLHTTETTDWPGYNNAGTPGDSAPHYTTKPDLKACTSAWRQHFSETISARALRNEAGGVETNTLNCVQVELIGTCDSAKAKTWKVGGVTLTAGVDYIYWPDAPAWALRDLAAFLTSIHKRRGVKLEAPKVWLPYPASYGATAARMTGAQWEGFYGVCGHQHVPENSHGDPGDIDITTLLSLAGAAPAPDPRVARIRARIKRLRARLNHILGK